MTPWKSLETLEIQNGCNRGHARVIEWNGTERTTWKADVSPVYQSVLLDTAGMTCPYEPITICLSTIAQIQALTMASTIPSASGS